MPDADGLPTYEEVTGVQRILPFHLSRQITERIVERDEDVRSPTTTQQNVIPTPFCNTRLAWYLTFVCVPIIVLGVLMLIVGAPFIEGCGESWLPIYLAVGGSICLLFSILCLIFGLRLCMRKQARLVEAQMKQLSCLMMMIYLVIGLAIICFIAGCIVTWPAISEVNTIKNALEANEPKADWWEASEKAACEGPVLYLSLVSTIFPFVYCAFICTIGCKKLKAIPEERGDELEQTQCLASN